MNAWLITAGLVWALVCMLALYVPAWVEWGYEQTSAWVTTLVGAGWAGSALAVIFGRRVRPAAPEQKRRKVLGLLNLLSNVFLVGLLLLGAFAFHHALNAAAGRTAAPVGRGAVITTFQLSTAQSGLGTHSEVHLTEREVPNPGVYASMRLADTDLVRAHRISTGFWFAPYLPVVFVALALVFEIVGWRVDVNTFSLHNLYKNRLMRCYLGASRVGRQPLRSTGLDVNDDLPLKKLQCQDDANGTPQRPIHLINATLNLTYGADLAWQERKAASFTMSPFFCGYQLAPSRREGGGHSPGAAFQPTELYLGGHLTFGPMLHALREDLSHRLGGTASWTDAGAPATRWAVRRVPLRALTPQDDEGVSLGMAMATSGAAVSPNQGENSQPALAFLRLI